MTGMDYFNFPNLLSIQTLIIRKCVCFICSINTYYFNHTLPLQRKLPSNLLSVDVN